MATCELPARDVVGIGDDASGANGFLGHGPGAERQAVERDQILVGALTRDRKPCRRGIRTCEADDAGLQQRQDVGIGRIDRQAGQLLTREEPLRRAGLRTFARPRRLSRVDHNRVEHGGHR